MKLSSWPETGSDGDVLLTPCVPKGITGYDDDDSVHVLQSRRPGSVVGIATAYGLNGPRIESRWGGAIFSAPVQTGPEAHSASCTMGTGSFPGVRWGRVVTLTPHPF